MLITRCGDESVTLFTQRHFLIPAHQGLDHVGMKYGDPSCLKSFLEHSPKRMESQSFRKRLR